MSQDRHVGDSSAPADPLGDGRLRHEIATRARDRQSELGELPTAEQLMAYRQGSLDEETEVWVRSWLATDAELASLYLDLIGQGEQAEGEASASAEASAPSELDLEALWAEQQARRRSLSAGSRVPLRGGSPSEEPTRSSSRGRPQPSTHRRTLLLAAVLAGVVLGAWALFELVFQPAGPAGEYQVVQIEPGLSRAVLVIELSSSVKGIELQLARPEPRDSGRWEIHVQNAQGRSVHRVTVELEAEAKVGAGAPLVSRVPLRLLQMGRPYLLEARKLPADPSRPAEISVVFELERRP